jgi:hypothetical protein
MAGMSRKQADLPKLFLLLAVLLAGVGGTVKSAPSEGEQVQFDHIVLEYVLTHLPGLAGDWSDRTFYISLDGHDPSPTFLGSFSGAQKLQPMRMAPPIPPGPWDDPKDKTIRVRIGYLTDPVVAAGLGYAQGEVQIWCGKECGNKSRVTLKKSGGAWKVTSYQLLTAY